MKTLSISGLDVSFSTPKGRLLALRKVSFDVPKNRIVGLVGESGCGKSTVINAILGLLADNGAIDGGTIEFEGQQLTQLDPSQMRGLRGQRISTVFQDPMGSLNPVISIGKQMRDIQYRSNISRADKDTRSIEMLRQVRIPDAASALRRYSHEFSGGMKQRIAIAMALMMEPSLLIADEPTTALDATLEVATIELLQELQAQLGCSVLFISHHLGVIAELCQEVVVMYAGEVVESGSTRQIFYKPRHPYTERLLQCDPAGQVKRTRNLPTIPGEIPDLHQRFSGCIFAPRCHCREQICETDPPVVDRSGHRAKCHREAA